MPLRKFDVSWVKRVFQNGRHLEPEVELQLNRKALIVSCLLWKRSWSRQRNLVLVYKQFCCNLEPQNASLIQIHKIFKMAVTLNRKWCINRKITFISLESLFIFHFTIITSCLGILLLKTTFIICLSYRYILYIQMQLTAGYVWTKIFQQVTFF